MTTTREWAAAHGICIEDRVPPVKDGHESPHRTAEEIAVRAVVLHCVAAVGYGVDRQPVVEWLKSEHVWEQVSPWEKAFLSDEAASDDDCIAARWRQEAEWALLWMVQKVETLGLPTQTCDTGRLIDEIMPPLGDPIAPFISSATLRLPGELLAEDDRIYNLHCYARQAYRRNAMPKDLVYGVLFQRHYAFEWLSSDADWDEVRTDT